MTFAASSGSGSPASAKAPPSLVAEEDAWHAQRIARLTAEDGWLTLVGLHWLEEGDNTAGSAKDAQVPLPASLPAKFGKFTRKGEQVTFTPAPGVDVTLDGRPFRGGALKTDRQGAPDVLRAGTVQLLVIVRGDRVGVRVRDAASGVRRRFRGIDRFPVSAEWRKEARFEPAPKGTTVSITNVLGQVEQVPLAGDVVLSHEGKEYRLEAVEEDGGLFIVFGDLTNRDTTYPAGRFLQADAPKDGKVILDFNRAYNPPCAFTAFATCPLPTKKNRLPFRVEAGEKRFGDHS
ncbi:MAG: DUF1684 domain-containing protein [Myxococcaceae bacterium]|nr:DUF1684 domain-containing protein [Myxococcaceae bacterium]